MAAASNILKAAAVAAMGLAVALAMAASGVAQDVSGSWSAIELAGEPVRGPSVSFDDGRLSGSGGCNRISGPAVITGADVKFGPLISTRMFCEGKMETEAAFIAALESAKSFELVDDALTLKDAAGVALAKFTR
jgi:heat shock protein HslJ